MSVQEQIETENDLAQASFRFGAVDLKNGDCDAAILCAQAAIRHIERIKVLSGEKKP